MTMALMARSLGLPARVVMGFQADQLRGHGGRHRRDGDRLGGDPVRRGRLGGVRSDAGRGEGAAAEGRQAVGGQPTEQAAAPAPAARHQAGRHPVGEGRRSAGRPAGREEGRRPAATCVGHALGALGADRPVTTGVAGAVRIDHSAEVGAAAPSAAGSAGGQDRRRLGASDGCGDRPRRSAAPRGHPAGNRGCVGFPLRRIDGTAGQGSRHPRVGAGRGGVRPTPTGSGPTWMARSPACPGPADPGGGCGPPCRPGRCAVATASGGSDDGPRLRSARVHGAVAPWVRTRCAVHSAAHRRPPRWISSTLPTPAGGPSRCWWTWCHRPRCWLSGFWWTRRCAGTCSAPPVPGA